MYINISKIYKTKNKLYFFSGLITVFLIFRYFYYIRFIIFYPTIYEFLDLKVRPKV